MNANRALFEAAKIQFAAISANVDLLQVKKTKIRHQQVENKRRLQEPDFEYDKEVDERLSEKLNEAQAEYNEVLENYSRASFFLASAFGVLCVEDDKESEDYLVEAADRIKDRLFPMLESLNNLPSFDKAEAGDDEFFSDILNMGNIYMTAFKMSLVESMDQLDHKSQQQQYSLKHLPMDRNPTLDRKSDIKMTVVKLDPEKK